MRQPAPCIEQARELEMAQWGNAMPRRVHAQGCSAHGRTSARAAAGPCMQGMYFR